MTEAELAYERARVATTALYEAWEGQSHSTVEGRARITAALAEYNAAATALAQAWERQDSGAPLPPRLSSLEDAGDTRDEGSLPEQEIGGPAG